MITIQKQLSLPDTYPLDRIGSLGRLLFFDIETTGFSGTSSSLYLIGCTYYQNQTWHLVQWFADTAESEEELLHRFFHFLADFSILIHFNGDSFDIPFLLKRCAHYQLSYDFSSVESFDIYRRIRPYKKLLQLDSLKQKAIEQFLGVSRQDQYSGGQLIDVYKDYLVTQEPMLYDLLLLHNEDDLKGMPFILPILNYPDFLEHPFALAAYQVIDGAAIFGHPCRCLELSCKNGRDIPVPLSFLSPPVLLQAREDCLTLCVELFEGNLKYFYPNYRDYYYLPYEDTAIHKSVGEYVDKSARVRATAKTCYTIKEGCFLPQFQPLWKPEFKKDLKDNLSYADLTQIHWNDSDWFSPYFRQLLLFLGINGSILM